MVCENKFGLGDLDKIRGHVLLVENVDVCGLEKKLICVPRKLGVSLQHSFDLFLSNELCAVFVCLVSSSHAGSCPSCDGSVMKPWVLPMGTQLERARRDQIGTLERPRDFQSCHLYLSVFFVCAENISSSPNDCGCVAPCKRERFEPSLSYAQLSRVNIERFIIQDESQKVQLQVRLTSVFSGWNACFVSLDHKNVRAETKL